MLAFFHSQDRFSRRGFPRTFFHDKFVLSTFLQWYRVFIYIPPTLGDQAHRDT